MLVGKTPSVPLKGEAMGGKLLHQNGNWVGDRLEPAAQVFGKEKAKRRV